MKNNFLYKLLAYAVTLDKKEPYELSIKREKKGEKKAISTIKGNEVEIVNGLANLINRLIKSGIDKEMLKLAIDSAFN